MWETKKKSVFIWHTMIFFLYKHTYNHIILLFSLYFIFFIKKDFIFEAPRTHLFTSLHLKLICIPSFYLRLIGSIKVKLRKKQPLFWLECRLFSFRRCQFFSQKKKTQKKNSYFELERRWNLFPLLLLFLIFRFLIYNDGCVYLCIWCIIMSNYVLYLYSSCIELRFYESKRKIFLKQHAISSYLFLLLPEKIKI